MLSLRYGWWGEKDTEWNNFTSIQGKMLDEFPEILNFMEKWTTIFDEAGGGFQMTIGDSNHPIPPWESHVGLVTFSPWDVVENDKVVE